MAAREVVALLLFKQPLQMLVTLADSLSQAGSVRQIRCDAWIFIFGDIPDDDLGAPDVDHQIDVKPDATDAGRQIGEDPTPHLIRPSSLQSWYVAGSMGRPGTATAMGLAMGMEHALKTALHADTSATISQDRHDLTRR
ncbi:hypothetical protein OGCDGJMD_00258 [Cyanobium usitatum str. Tous]|uniref:hypothetical protein n=1 Tax=Cyanobium usitatum TaxID=2304190 RepID=UPI002AD3099E|nr:hypothetical protein [Cyanobium usitatum]CAK6687619.1 hypothetical protein OGCDGJMD_00258 [Cyanobium usitatum str. Tous]